MAPTQPQPTIDLHRASAIQPCPFKRQNPVQRAVGEGEQFLTGNHRHRAAVGNGLVRWRRRITLRVRRHSRHIIDRLLTDQRGALGLAAHHRHRVRNQRVARLQRHSRHRLNRRRRTAQQHRLGGLDMSFQPRPHYLLGQQFQQRPRPPGFDVTEHTSPQSHHHAHRTQHANQQQIDQHLTGNLTPQFSHLRWREHAHPADQRRQVDKQQRLITEHQQALGYRITAQCQQFIELGLRKVLQQFFAVGLEVRQQRRQLANVVPQAVKRFA
ncbi:hypothetical protein PFLuk1_03613 [Pseudomonas fluorescens]|nr:hypothetical protein PFLuk1_03613 [Pseudomonas fluorescens]